MYAALDKNGILIYAQQALVNKKYYCCHCDKQVKLILTESRKYFRHTNRVDNEVNERIIHLQGKELIKKIFVSLGCQVEKEIYLESIKQRPDLLINWKLAVEYQCAKLNAQSLDERVCGYNQFGMRNIWILGGSYLSNRVKREHLKFISYDSKLAYHLIMLDSAKKLLVVFHHIRFEGPFSRIHFQRMFLPENKFVRVFTVHPQVPELSAQVMNQKLLKQIRQKNDLISRKIKSSFYQQYQVTVETFLADKRFLPQAPIYRHHAWQIACGASKEHLNQPLLKQIKRPPQM